jgi:hypothetical protein
MIVDGRSLSERRHRDHAIMRLFCPTGQQIFEKSAKRLNS